MKVLFWILVCIIVLLSLELILQIIGDDVQLLTLSVLIICYVIAHLIRKTLLANQDSNQK